MMDEFNLNNLIKRTDGRIEWTCPHGIGHTISVPKRFEKDGSYWIHGCDGCCKGMKEKYERWKAKNEI